MSGSLARLTRHAREFGRAYAALKEALVTQGVPDAEAREEARYAASLAVASESNGTDTGEACPLCGR